MAGGTKRRFTGKSKYNNGGPKRTKQFHGEIKNFDVFDDFNITSQTAHVTLINQIALGTSDQSRIGRKIKNQKLHIRCLVTARASETPVEVEPQNVRILVVKSHNTQTLSIGDVLDANSIQGGSDLDAPDVPVQVTVNSVTVRFRNLDKTRRFTVLWDKNVAIPMANAQLTEPGNDGYNTGGNRLIQKTINLRGFDSFYQDAGNTITLESGGIQVFFVNGVPDTQSAGINILWNSRLRYSDA